MKPAAPRVLGAAVAAAAFLALLPALSNSFVDWDDFVFLVRNTRYQGLGLENLAWMATARMGGHYHPLTWLSYAADFIVWGVNPFGFHLTNLLLHAANAWVFYELARRLLAAADPTLAPARAAFAAAAAAGLFAVHPLRVESVAWASERRDVLSALFYLLTVRDYLDGRRRRSLVFFACSLLSKAVGVTLPLALLTLDYFPLRRPAPWREQLRDKAAYLALAAAALLVNAGTQSFNGALEGFGGYPIAHRLAASAYSLIFYIGRTFAPLHLVPIYEFPDALNPLAARFAGSAALALLVTAAAAALRRRHPALAASWAYYALTLLPTIGLVRFGPQLVADRYSYLATLPLALLGGAALERLGRRSVLAAAASCLVLLASLAALSWRQCAVWKDTDAFWAYVLAQAPDTAIAHHNVARRLDAQNRLPEAIAHYERALEIRPRYALAMSNLGLALMRTGRAARAEPLFLRALEVKPDYWEARANLALLRAAQGRFDEALIDMEAAVALEPGRPSLRRNLAAIAARAAQRP